jgi:hypothetical protein
MAALLLCACFDSPDFARSSLVTGPRVLALVAEPPEAAPGDPFALSLLIAGADHEEVEVSWRACGAFDSGGSFGGGMQFGERDPDEGCGGGFAVPLGEGRSSVLPGELTRALFDNLELAAVILGAALPDDALERIRSDVGIPFLIEADVHIGEKRIRTVKRVLVRETEAAHQNPPPPSFMLGDAEIVSEGDEFVCGALDGVTPRVRRSSDVELEPMLQGNEGEDEPWLERYHVLDAQGQLLERTERAYYSWFSDGGRLDQQLTRAPLRNEVWTTPDEPGEHTLWVVVRDGHGGTSACGLAIVVE